MATSARLQLRVCTRGGALVCHREAAVKHARVLVVAGERRRCWSPPMSPGHPCACQLRTSEAAGPNSVPAYGQEGAAGPVEHVLTVPHALAVRPHACPGRLTHAAVARRGQVAVS